LPLCSEEGIGPRIPNLGTCWRWAVSFMLRPLYLEEVSPSNHPYCVIGWVGPRDDGSGRCGEGKNTNLLSLPGTESHSSCCPACKSKRCNDRWWWVFSSRWNENWQGKPKYSEKICPSATSFTTGPPRWEAGDQPPGLLRRLPCFTWDTYNRLNFSDCI
jgi:hypothetical protein